MRGQMAEIGMRCWVFLPRKVNFARLYHARRWSSSRRVREDGWQSGLGEPPFPCTGQPAPHSRFSRPHFSPMPVARCQSPVCPSSLLDLPHVQCSPVQCLCLGTLLPSSWAHPAVWGNLSLRMDASSSVKTVSTKAPLACRYPARNVQSETRILCSVVAHAGHSASPKTRYPHISTSPRIVLPLPTPHKELRGFLPPLRADDGHGIQTQPFRLVVGVRELAVPAHPLPTLP